MTLHQSFGAKQQIIRLQALPDLPTPAELQFAISQAKEHAKAIIELPFRGGKSDMVLQLFLTPKEGAPRWTMYGGPTTDAAVVWTLDSHDTEFIKTMIDQAESSTQKTVASAAIPDELRPQAPRTTQAAPVYQEPSPAPPPATTGSAAYAAPPTAPPPLGHKQNLAPVPLNMPAVQAAFSQLTDPRAGLLSDGAFLFFLMRENAIFQSGGKPFSLLLFEMGLKGRGALHGITPEALAEAARRIYSVVGTINLVGHYNDSQYAMLLLNSSRNEAGRLASHVLDALTNQPIVPGGEWQIAFYAGIAAMPDDTNHPGLLLAQASYAKDVAKHKGFPIVLFADA